MRIELKGLPAIEVESGDNPKGHELVERVLASDGIEAVIAEIAKSSYYSAYATWDSMEKSTAKDIAEALFEGGVTAAEDKVIEIVDSGGSGAHEEYRQMMAPQGHGNTRNLDIIAEAIAEACDEFVSGIREALVEGLQDPVIEAFQDADESNVLDVVPDHVRVEVIYFFGLEGGAFDDRYTQNVSNVSNLGTIHPDENLAAAFTGFNLPVAAFREAVKAKYGFDMAAGSKDADFVGFLTDEDYLGDRGRARERAVERADEWAAFDPVHDAARPASITPTDMLTVITESGGGGVPVFVARPTLKSLLAHDWEKPLRFEPDTGYGAKRSGGFVGIFDAVNGSGYIESPCAPVEIPADRAGWGVSGRRGREVDDTFGIVPSYYYARLETLDAPEPEPEAPRM